METTLKAIEVEGKIDENGQLHLDEPLNSSSVRVRVIILIAGEHNSVDDMDERKWLKAAANNPAFDFLKDPVEDVYTVEDGKPFYDEK